MKISAKLVMELRAKTNAGMMDCKKALIQTEGDMQAAMDYLREKGIMKAAKKASRIAAEGLVFAVISEDGKEGAVLELNSETDFVAKNTEFIDFGKNVVKLVLINNFKDIDELNSAEFQSSTVQETLSDLIAKIGENMKLRRFKKESSASFVTIYVHMGGKVAVLVNYNGENNDENQIKAKDVAMHIAAMSPDYLDQKEVPKEVLDKERDILRKQLLEEGKPEKIIDKILIGKLNKFYEENCLLQQKFVKDDKITVSTYLNALHIASFTRFKLGEGLEKRSEDFAAEVEAQMNA